jgi:phenylacetyl-CoA:acceptor oxidoreductase
MKVEVVEGVATRVEPNFDLHGQHPADGKVCVKPYGHIQKLYNPHRILQPMRRTNPRKGREEDPGWVAISWDEALDQVAEKLCRIRARGLRDEQGNPRLAVTTGGGGTPYWYMGTFLAFLDAWGPVDKSLGAGGTVKCYHSEHVFGELWHRAFITAPDTPICNFVVSFGNNIDVGGGVTGVRRHADARARGCRRIQFEPHLSVTGASASRWIPIKPNTDSAVLFALLHVLVNEHRTADLDVPFLKHRTAAPYLVGPNGYYLRDPVTRKPLLWDHGAQRTAPFDRPGTDPALEGSYSVDALELGADEDAWEHRGVAAEPAFARLRAHLAACTPEWAATVSDVPAAAIREVAEEFLAQARIGATVEIEGRTLPYRPVAVVLGRGVNNGWGSYECVWARTLLVALVGALEVPGGQLGSTVVINAPPFNRIDTVRAGADGFMEQSFNPTDRVHWMAQPSVRHAHQTLLPLVGDSFYAQNLGAATLTWLRLQGRAAATWPKPNPPDVWMFYRANPLISYSDTRRLAETIAAIPYVVAFAYTHDETNHYADVLLPEAMDLESTQLVHIGGTTDMEQFWKTEGWALRQPVIAPRGEARDFSWIASELARRCGIRESYYGVINAGGTGVPLKTPQYDYSLDPALDHGPEAIWDAACRAASRVVTDGREELGLDWFRRNGFKTRPYSQLNWYLYPKFEDLGLRFELPWQERLTRVGTQLERRLHEQGVHWWDRQLADYEPLPRWKDVCRLWEEALERTFQIDMRDFPFWLLTSRSMQYAWGSNVSVPLIREVADNVTGHDGIMISATVAAELGIREGELIEVRSPIAATRGRARLRLGMRPDTIVMLAQFGHWKTPYARDLDRPSLNALVPMLLDLTDGTGSNNDMVRVAVRRLTGQPPHDADASSRSAG